MKEGKQIETQFINLQTDFGFKLIFGSPRHKHILIRFLNALFNGEFKVTDVSFHDKEILPKSKDGKRIIYDVYCTSSHIRKDSPFFPSNQLSEKKRELDTPHHFILEMQNMYTPPFEERLAYYASQIISNQGKAGWDYTLEPVFAIAVVDFNFNHIKPKLLSDFMLRDAETGEPLTKKIHLMVCSLKEVPEKWEDCSSELSQMLYLIKNMDTMTTDSQPYMEGNYYDFFNAAERDTLNEEEVVYYSQSLEKLRDTQRGIEYAKEEAAKQAWDEALTKGMAQGIAEGMAQGMAQARMEIARSMMASGLSKKQIAEFTGLSSDEISQL